jgi:hypothetical protein
MAKLIILPAALLHIFMVALQLQLLLQLLLQLHNLPQFQFQLRLMVLSQHQVQAQINQVHGLASDQTTTAASAGRNVLPKVIGGHALRNGDAKQTTLHLRPRHQQYMLRLNQHPLQQHHAPVPLRLKQPPVLVVVQPTGLASNRIARAASAGRSALSMATNGRAQRSGNATLKSTLLSISLATYGSNLVMIVYFCSRYLLHSILTQAEL